MITMIIIITIIIIIYGLVSTALVRTIALYGPPLIMFLASGFGSYLADISQSKSHTTHFYTILSYVILCPAHLSLIVFPILCSAHLCYTILIIVI